LTRPPPFPVLPLGFHCGNLSLVSLIQQFSNKAQFRSGISTLWNLNNAQHSDDGNGTDERSVRATLKRSFYRNGQLREEVPLRKDRRHGVVRSWHKNGVLAGEEAYRNGLLHGVCRQWNEAGRLLGKYRMVNGTGIQRAWHDNGQLQSELSTVRGEFSGRSRMWLHDGTLLSERIYLHGRIVSAEAYREAAKKDTSLPKLRGQPAGARRESPASEYRIHRVFTKWLLGKSGGDAAEWLHHNGEAKAARSLGRFKREGDAVKFVQSLYQAGAAKVVVSDVYTKKNGDQFADYLLVKLPKDAKRRKAIRSICAQLQKRKLGAFEPEKDIGETHLYLSMT
jgi:hypothetical protein